MKTHAVQEAMTVAIFPLCCYAYSQTALVELMIALIMSATMELWYVIVYKKLKL